jgi:hypothetical protein
MKTSKTHQIFGFDEKCLGPNWEAVINFWLYIDTLSKEQLKVVKKLYLNLSAEEDNIAYSKARISAADTTNFYSIAVNAAYNGASGANDPAAWVTLELIGLDKLLVEGYKPLFFPLFLNL